MADNNGSYGNRSDDNLSKFSRQVSKYPVPALAISSTVSVIVSLISAMSFMTSPLRDDIVELKGSIEIARAHIHEITTKIGSKPRAAGDVARIYGMIDGIKRELDIMHNRINNMAPASSRIRHRTNSTFGSFEAKKNE